MIGKVNENYRPV